MDPQALLTHPFAPPSLPRAVALLMNELGADEPNLRRVNQWFSSDPALAARLLAQANALAGPLQRRVVGISEALALLDIAQLRTLVAQAPLGTASRSVPGIHLPLFWRYSLNTAKVARALAGYVHANQSAAYTAGLLHGLGELLLIAAAGRRLQAVQEVALPLDLRRARLEQHVLGFSYAQVSAALARRWQLPQDVVDALQYHCAPFDNQAYEPLAGVLHLAVWRARARVAGLGERELAVTFPGEVGVTLGLDIDMVLQQDPIDWKAQGEDGDYL